MPVSFSHFSRVVRINSDLVTVYQIISSWPFQFTQEQIPSLYQESNFLEFISYHHCTLRFTSYHVVRCRKPPRVTRIHWGLSHFQKTPSTLNVWDMICYILIYIYTCIRYIFFELVWLFWYTPFSGFCVSWSKIVWTHFERRDWSGRPSFMSLPQTIIEYTYIPYHSYTYGYLKNQKLSRQVDWGP